MDIQTGSTVVSWIVQGKEILALVVLCCILVYTYVKLIPYLLDREAKRSGEAAEQFSAGMKELASAVREGFGRLESRLDDTDRRPPRSRS